MAESKRDRLLPEARALAAEGVPNREIAAALDVAPSTIRRWARCDAEAGRPWRKPGAPTAATPPPRRADRLYNRVEGLLEQLIDESDVEQKSANLENRMLKLCRVLEHLRERRDDLEGQLAAMQRFGAFCARNLPEEQMRPVRRAVRLFLDDLKREHS